MSIQVGINHLTRYRFDRPVGVTPHIVRLRPAPHCRTPIAAYSLAIEPADHFINWQQDPFGNYLARIVFAEKTTELSFEVDLTADLTIINPFDFFLDESAEVVPFAYGENLARELAPYLEIAERGPLLTSWLARVDRSRQRTVDFLVALNQRLCDDISYVVRFEPGVQTCEETLATKRGSCRDSGWLLVQILRHLGLAARFVSGYLVQLTADTPALDGPSGPTADFTDLHAWAEVYVPGAGWIGLDPTSGLFAGEGHIPLACTALPSSAAPIEGATEPCEAVFSYHNRVERIHEDPRVTKPYSETQWQAIDALGRQVDEALAVNDVRLTMGGEPTFVAIDDTQSAEWNTAADGEDKRRRANQLLRALAARFAPHGLLHFGQGKWYPGEALPRWAYSCFCRSDGEPLWHDASLLAHHESPTGTTIEDAQGFAAALARSLGIGEAFIVPGFEDWFYYAWKEGSLPANVDPFAIDRDDPREWQTLTELLRRGARIPTGFALPIRRSDDGTWRSSQWRFQRDHMFLIPGTSPMGLRLPLESLPWAHPDDREVDHDRSPFAERGALHPARQMFVERQSRDLDVQRPVGAEGTLANLPLRRRGEPDEVVRTAVCIEPRDGFLHVFLPPLKHLEAFVDLIESIEAAAAERATPVVLEGYEPPRDTRLRRFSVTPDPGVIEVNVHPSRTWGDLAQVTEVLYEEARLCRLSTEKFMLDGRHTGTGGGNHVTLGGPTAADSPMLRRPDLLRSLVTYWQHHPSLSYVFSGMFVGPTSQAPRADEARDDSLYDLEIAFQQMPAGEVPQPWLVDRLLRNLLIDVTGNTHRAEFCIDKLYSPAGDTGRLGLLEMRAFEMPPHARMSLVQQLLLRSLIARFWQRPYRRPLVRWGTALHDRFMLPHYLWEDLRNVVAELRDDGFAFELGWFAPFLEFRFPRCGTLHVADMALELRNAVEPWLVLGEEVASQGTARYVDSSVERLQVKLTGAFGNRHIVACNGRRVPLRPTTTPGEAVAGVRYRAWQPPSALHPTIPVHAPLVFDIVDTWNGRSIGGCTYHVAHPGGRNYEVFPVNANEAEARRVARFWAHGHTAGSMDAPLEEGSSEFPHTLDLRRRDQF